MKPIKKDQYLLKGDYVLATKWSDGDPQDQWAIGFFDEMLPKSSGDRYMVIDNNGKQFCNNGFRRLKKISQTRGAWLLSRKLDIERGTKSLWWWVRQPMNIYA